MDVNYIEYAYENLPAMLGETFIFPRKQNIQYAPQFSKSFQEQKASFHPIATISFQKLKISHLETLQFFYQCSLPEILEIQGHHGYWTVFSFCTCPWKLAYFGKFDMVPREETFFPAWLCIKTTLILSLQQLSGEWFDNSCNPWSNPCVQMTVHSCTCTVYIDFSLCYFCHKFR